MKILLLDVPRLDLSYVQKRLFHNGMSTLHFYVFASEFKLCSLLLAPLYSDESVLVDQCSRGAAQGGHPPSIRYVSKY